MGETPQLSVLIPWCQRDELRLTLAANAPFFRAQEAEVLILNCAGESKSLQRLIAASEVSGVRQLDISAPRFNKSLALNVGLSQCRADNVFVLDADVIVLDAALWESKVSIDDGAFVTIEWVYESEPTASARATGRDDANNFTTGLTSSAILEFAFRDGVRVQHQLSCRDIFGNRRASPGLLLAKKSDLLDIQAYNSKLETWGWEDDDVLVRLQYRLGRRRVQRGSALHLSHGDDRRVLQGSRSQSDRFNFLKCCRNYNRGLFLGTYNSDLAWAADKVTETVLEGCSEPRSIAASQSCMPGLQDCGNANNMRLDASRDSNVPEVSLSELLLTAALRKLAVQNTTILHVGIGHSAMASRLSSRCRHITGVTLEVCNKGSDEFLTHLQFQAYDIIVDAGLARDACCQRHLSALIENYIRVLEPAGSIVTTLNHIGQSVDSGGRTLTECDLAFVARQFDLCVTKTGYDVFTLSRRADSRQG